MIREHHMQSITMSMFTEHTPFSNIVPPDSMFVIISKQFMAWNLKIFCNIIQKKCNARGFISCCLLYSDLWIINIGIFLLHIQIYT